MATRSNFDAAAVFPRAIGKGRHVFQLCFARSRSSRLAGLIGSLILAATTALAQPPVAPTIDSRASRWQADLDVFAREFPKRQKDFDRLYPRAPFNRDLEAIRQSILASSDAGIVLALSRLVASGGYLHTTVSSYAQAPGGGSYLPTLPIALTWFSDGLAVTAATESNRGLLGARVLHIGHLTPEQWETQVAPYIAIETDGWLHYKSPRAMATVELLRQAALIGADNKVVFELARPGIPPWTERVSADPVALTTQWINFHDSRHVPTELRLAHPDASYWYQLLPEKRTLYFNYSRCEEDPQQPFRDLVARAMAEADTGQAERFILDLRANLGGSSHVLLPLLDALRSRPALSRRGHLYVLIGRATVSSGLIAAWELVRRYHAIVIGEPSGEKLDSYGLIQSFSLPNSNLPIQVSTRFFHLSGHGEGPLPAPDILVQRSLDDALDGRDPALEASLAHPLE
jgi:hypothetical protein